jgi:hypothetical protein
VREREEREGIEAVGNQRGGSVNMRVSVCVYRDMYVFVYVCVDELV